MERQTLRDWVHRYNAEGVPGLYLRVGSGPAPLLSEAQMAELKDLVVSGPDPETDKVVRWRCVDLREKIAQRFSILVHKRTVAKWRSCQRFQGRMPLEGQRRLRQLELTRLQPRPCYPKKDAPAQEAFKKLLQPEL